jgi:hypothetical protein
MMAYQIPVQPNAKRYPVSSLFLFQSLTENQAPAGTTRPFGPRQTWRDPSAPMSFQMVSYPNAWNTLARRMLNAAFQDQGVFAASYYFAGEPTTGNSWVPCRALLPNEQVEGGASSLFSPGEVMIVRTDLNEDGTPIVAAPAPSGGALTGLADVNAKLDRIITKLNA